MPARPLVFPKADLVLHRKPRPEPTRDALICIESQLLPSPPTLNNLPFLSQLLFSEPQSPLPGSAQAQPGHRLWTRLVVRTRGESLKAAAGPRQTPAVLGVPLIRLPRAVDTLAAEALELSPAIPRSLTKPRGCLAGRSLCPSLCPGLPTYVLFLPTSKNLL